TGARRVRAGPRLTACFSGRGTQRATGTVIEYRQAEPVEAKGKSQPVPAWEALRARARFGLDVDQRPRTRLIGREQELELLTRALERVRKDLSPQLVTL